jgi:hypothetical protein
MRIVFELLLIRQSSFDNQTSCGPTARQGSFGVVQTEGLPVLSPGRCARDLRRIPPGKRAYARFPFEGQLLAGADKKSPALIPVGMSVEDFAGILHASKTRVDPTTARRGFAALHSSHLHRSCATSCCLLRRPENSLFFACHCEGSSWSTRPVVSRLSDYGVSPLSKTSGPGANPTARFTTDLSHTNLGGISRYPKGVHHLRNAGASPHHVGWHQERSCEPLCLPFRIAVRRCVDGANRPGQAPLGVQN